MQKRTLIGLISISVLAAAAAAVTLPPEGSSSPAAALQPIPLDEHLRTITAMKPPKRIRPVVAVVGQNDGTETTDYIVPYAVLVDSGAADVVALATEDRALKLRPALTIMPQATTATFDARYPEGADYVIVPAITDRDAPDVVAWIKSQAAKGATIVAVCAGALTVSEAGLLADRSATGHWYDVEKLRKDNPTMRWARDRRYVADRGVVTTTGVSASLPVSLALVEAIAGRDRAAALARKYGVEQWDARHDSAAFSLDREMWWTGLRNKTALWARDTYGVRISQGVDDIALAFTADAWARTYRTRTLAVADREVVRTRLGLTVVADRTTADDRGVTVLPDLPAERTAETLPAALSGIQQRYGRRTARFVALQVEFPWRP